MMKQSDKNKDKIKVIYCMGSGRSGSTILGIILGNHPEIVSPGEITAVHRLSEEKFNCSCGKRVADCEFWSGVMREWTRLCGEEAVNNTLSNNKIEDFRSPIAWIKILLKYPGQSKYLQDYLENTYIFLKTILNNSGKSVMVDISKNPLRAYVLMQHPNIDLRLIHLVRDGRGVAWSMNKPRKVSVKRRAVWRTALFWLIVNKQSNFVRRKAKHSGLIRYEDLARYPEENLKKIGEMADIESQPIIDTINGDLALKESHIMAGNRLRREKSIKLRLDMDWQNEMSIDKQKSFIKITRKIMSKYGYLSNE